MKPDQGKGPKDGKGTPERGVIPEPKRGPFPGKGGGGGGSPFPGKRGGGFPMKQRTPTGNRRGG